MTAPISDIKTAKGSLSGQFQVNSYPCSKQLGAWSYAGVCTHAPTSGGRGHRRRRRLRLQRAAFRQAQRKGTALRVSGCASAPYRTDRVGRTRSAANGEGALLPKLLIFSRYGQSRCRETIQGVFGADPRVHKDGDGRATRQSCPGCMALKTRPSNAAQKFAQQCI
jgi:hypothetical protein